MPVPFKIYADFEWNLESAEVYEGSCTKNIKINILCNFVYKVVCIDDRFTKPIVVLRGQNADYEFIKRILKEYRYWKKKINEKTL